MPCALCPRRSSVESLCCLHVFTFGYMLTCHGQGRHFRTLALIGDRDCVTVGAKARGDYLQGA